MRVACESFFPVRFRFASSPCATSASRIRCAESVLRRTPRATLAHGWRREHTEEMLPELPELPVTVHRSFQHQHCEYQEGPLSLCSITH